MLLMTIFIFPLEKNNKIGLLKKTSAVFGSFTPSDRTKSVCGDTAEVSNSMVLRASGVAADGREDLTA